MPHKHRRDRIGDKASYELPPTTFAKPLPVIKQHLHSTANKISKRKRLNEDASNDDTPRAFARLMAFHTQGIKPRSGLDNGNMKSRKRKRANDTNDPALHPTTQKPEPPIPQIQPGERMSDFSARVDAALPVSGLIGKGTRNGNSIPGVKTPQTKTERKMQKMQKEWREAEARRKEKLEAEKEEAEAEDDDIRPSVRLPTTQSKKSKRRQDNDDEDDPWASVGKARTDNASSTGSGLVGIHDVVLAPPQFSKLPREKFGIKNGAKVQIFDVPGKAGSLRRREELGQARREVVEGYRAMMRGRKEMMSAV